MDVKWLGGDYPNIVFSSDDHTIRHFAPHDLTSKIFRYHDAMVWVCLFLLTFYISVQLNKKHSYHTSTYSMSTARTG